MRGYWGDPMRYFFNYRDSGREFIDLEGTDLVDLAAAHEEARQSARELLGTERGENYVEFAGGAFEILNDRREVVGLVSFDDLAVGSRSA